MIKAAWGRWRSSECPLCILHTQAEGEEDPQTVLIAQTVTLLLVPRLSGGRRGQKEIRSGRRGPGCEVQSVPSWQCDRRQDPLGPASLVHTVKTSQMLEGSFVLLWNLGPSGKKHLSFYVTLPCCVSSLRPTNPLEVKERSQQAEVDRLCSEQTQSHTECLWPVCVHTTSYKLPKNYPWVNFPTKWLQTVGTENL